MLVCISAMEVYCKFFMYSQFIIIFRSPHIFQNSRSHALNSRRQKGDKSIQNSAVTLTVTATWRFLHGAPAVVDTSWNVMAHAQKPDFVFRRNGRVHLNQKGRGASVQSTIGSRGVRISGSNVGYTVFRGSVKSTENPLQSPGHWTATYSVWRYQMLYNTIWPPDDEHNSARNMQRNIINLL